MIAPTKLTQNYERLNKPYDPNQPIETFFKHIQDARAFGVVGGHVAYILVFNTVLFPDPFRAW
jgi:hypothetical protein